MADADYYIGPDWCHARCPDEKQWVCTKQAGHVGEHVAHICGKWNNRWHDGDTVSVKAGQMKPMASVPVTGASGSWVFGGNLGLTPPPPPPPMFVPHKMPANLPGPSRRELAESLLKTMVEWDMRSCTVKQQREFLDAIRMLKKEARQ